MPQVLLEGVRQNFSFLVVEVCKQIDDVLSVLKAPSKERIRRVHTRDGYINHLKDLISVKSYRVLLNEEVADKHTADLLQAVNTVAHNLENIGDHAENVVAQTRYLSDIKFFHAFDYKKFFDEIRPALRSVEESLFERDVDRAMTICRSEFVIDELYKDRFDQIMCQLRRRAQEGASQGEAQERQVENLVTSLFILRYLERIGDCLLNIGEAIISAAVGERLKIHEYLALGDSVSGDDFWDDDTDASSHVPPAAHLSSDDLAERVERSDELSFAFETVAETRSGGRVGRVRAKAGDADDRWILFKEGASTKIERERECIESWRALMPDLPPRVVGYKSDGKTAYLLLEYLEGLSFQKIIMTQDSARAGRALESLARVLTEVWEKTLCPGVVRADFTGQIDRRMDDLRSVHPGFDDHAAWIGSHRVHAFPELLERVRDFEQELVAPFSVLIHGDFNSDNVIYHQGTDSVNLIDLHRSRDMDLAQDVSVFMMSNLRLPVRDRRVQRRLRRASHGFYRFARSYARRHGDEAFDARLTLGLIRSYMTSARFVLDPTFARSMFHRAFYLMERLVEHRRVGLDWSRFELPLTILRD